MRKMGDRMGRGLLLLIRVGDTSVVHRLQLEIEDFLGLLDIVEGKRSVVEESFGHDAVDDLIDKATDTFFGVFAETAASSLDAICEHEDPLFTGVWVRPGVGEGLGIYLFVGVLISIRIVEVTCSAPPVMRADELDDGIGESVLLRQCDPVGDMADDHPGALLVGEELMGIAHGRVLGEELWMEHLADVVI